MTENWFSRAVCWWIRILFVSPADPSFLRHFRRPQVPRKLTLTHMFSTISDCGVCIDTVVLVPLIHQTRVLTRLNTNKRLAVWYVHRKKQEKREK